MTKRKPPDEFVQDNYRSPHAMTDAEIAERLGISRQRVDQIEREAGGAAEFQRAFDEAKIIAARKGERE